ncbi:hypothetical protein SAY87_006452 [Trapa incisa]|uniref:COBRA C-terminal domain-containing protein n=1 Tax=Trapa incisa TaxID=236973 RepID=A0AAN7K2C5_9MYRT|nr:hypothetical protein SAY87_006452 [Trapa incisa]
MGLFCVVVSLVLIYTLNQRFYSGDWHEIKRTFLVCSLSPIKLRTCPCETTASLSPSPCVGLSLCVSLPAFAEQILAEAKSAIRRMMESLPKLGGLALLLLFFLSSSTLTSVEAYDALDPNGNVTIKWDVISWTPDGYVAVVTIFNFQQYRHIPSPGWTLGWTWAKKEVIWSMMGGQTTEQGDCSRYKGNVPHCCKKDPTVVDLLPGTPYNQQIANCCKGGVISSWVQDPANAGSAFQVSVGAAGTSNKTVKLPKNFTLKAPGPGYTCGPAKIVRPTQYITADKRRRTQALMTWNITCTYSQFLAQKAPSCCVSLSTFYNDTIVNCPKCTCGCKNNATDPGGCLDPNTPHLESVVSNSPSNQPLVQCTSHMCPIRVHWHVKLNYKEYWRVKVTITNFNYRMNYTHWNMVVQHPNFDNLTQIFSFNYKPLTPYAGLNDTAMLYGVQFYNDLLSEAGPLGNVQSELLFRKDKSTFTFEKGWAFPRRIYFNGDNCVMPPPDSYPWLPNSSPRLGLPKLIPFTPILAYVLLLFLHL